MKQTFQQIETEEMSNDSKSISRRTVLYAEDVLSRYGIMKTVRKRLLRVTSIAAIKTISKLVPRTKTKHIGKKSSNAKNMSSIRFDVGQIRPCLLNCRSQLQQGARQLKLGSHKLFSKRHKKYQICAKRTSCTYKMRWLFRCGTLQVVEA